MVQAQERNVRKLVEGIVRKDAKDKTIVVVVARLVKHPLYGKYLRRQTKCHAHDEKNEARAGDRVRIMETRPISKTKRWRLCEIVERAKRELDL